MEGGRWKGAVLWKVEGGKELKAWRQRTKAVCMEGRGRQELMAWTDKQDNNISQEIMLRVFLAWAPHPECKKPQTIFGGQIDDPLHIWEAQLNPSYKPQSHQVLYTQ